jgi:hypothetical protein
VRVLAAAKHAAISIANERAHPRLGLSAATIRMGPNTAAASPTVSGFFRRAAKKLPTASPQKAVARELDHHFEEIATDLHSLNTRVHRGIIHRSRAARVHFRQLLAQDGGRVIQKKWRGCGGNVEKERIAVQRPSQTRWGFGGYEGAEVPHLPRQNHVRKRICKRDRRILNAPSTLSINWPATPASMTGNASFTSSRWPSAQAGDGTSTHLNITATS